LHSPDLTGSLLLIAAALLMAAAAAFVLFCLKPLPNKSSPTKQTFLLPDQLRCLELRFLDGLSIEDIAKVMQVSPAFAEKQISGAIEWIKTNRAHDDTGQFTDGELIKEALQSNVRERR
jgi:predicted DNA-binding protein (UPF0251 family)